MASAAASRSETGGPGWFATLLGVVVLVSGGFLAGVLVGVVSQEPELVAEHMAGRSEIVDWSAGPGAPLSESQPVPPEVGANVGPADPWERVDSSSEAQPSAGAARGVRLKETAAAAPSRPPPAVSSPGPRAHAPPAAGYAVQVGAFEHATVAEKLAAQLGAKGFSAYVTPSPAASMQRWRVRVGPLPTRHEADEVARRLKASEQLPTWVLREAGT